HAAAGHVALHHADGDTAGRALGRPELPPAQPEAEPGPGDEADPPRPRRPAETGPAGPPEPDRRDPPPAPAAPRQPAHERAPGRPDQRQEPGQRRAHGRVGEPDPAEAAERDPGVAELDRDPGTGGPQRPQPEPGDPGESEA